MSDAKPQYARDSEWEFARSLANFWCWGAMIEAKELPNLPTSFYVYPRHLAMGGPTLLNGKRIVVTISIEEEV